MTDKEVMQVALDALWKSFNVEATRGNLLKAIKILDAALAQPENEFNPDWDAMAVMVEEQQRIANRIEELEAKLAQPEPEPVAWADKYDVEREGHDFWVSRQQPAKNGVPLYVAPPAPTKLITVGGVLEQAGYVKKKEWVGLTNEEMDNLSECASHEFAFGRAVEAKLKEKNYD
jgi:hypothetical protein